MKKFLKLFFTKLAYWLKLILSAHLTLYPEIPDPKVKAASKKLSPLKAFVEKYTGVAVDFDGHFGAQCVDLVRQYWQEVEQIPQPEPTGTDGAIAFFNKHHNRPIQREQLCLVTYLPGMIPTPGAVVVFGAVSTNRFGHIGICLDADKDGIDLFEQNGAANSRAKAEGREQQGAFVGRWGYDRVLGWLVRRHDRR